MELSPKYALVGPCGSSKHCSSTLCRLQNWKSVDLSWDKKMPGFLLGCLQERAFIDAGCRTGDVMAAGIAGHAGIH